MAQETLVEEPLQIPTEIAHKTKRWQNRPHDNAKNRPHENSRNRPDIITPVPVRGVIDLRSLKSLLKDKNQIAWCSRVRLLGLLLLIDHICRREKTEFSISADLARSFCSKLRKRDRVTTIAEPVYLLCAIGILQKVRPAVFAHIKTSAVYCFADLYRKTRITLKVVLPPKLANKHEHADERCEQRLNRKYPWRAKLLEDLDAISFWHAARRIIGKGLSGKSTENLNRLIIAVDTQAHFVTVSERGQITTSISNCPRDLQPHLLLYGEPTANCDISNAHWIFLPLILARRLNHVSADSSRENYVRDGWREHARLIGILSEGDFYGRWCANPNDNDERNEKKDVLNVLLNKKNEDCERNILYRKIREEFPITFRTIEDLKYKDHRNLSKQLHRFTADAIAAALLDVQQGGIAAIPHVDALICRHSDTDRVCEAIGGRILEMTGVRCKVGGLRYSPSKSQTAMTA